MENEIENANSDNGEAEAVVETQEGETETIDERDSKIAALEKEKADLEAKNKQLFERAKKQSVTIKQAEGTLSAKDMLAVVSAKVDTEDFDEVTGYAKYRNISVADALKDKTLQSILNDRAEERKTANATQTKSARGTSKTSGDDLYEKARSGGDIAESDTDKLAEARIARLKARNT